MSPTWKANPWYPQPQVQAIDSALQRVGSSTPYAAFAPSAGITSVDPNNTIHFDAPALRTYGRRCFETLNQAIERR